LNSKQTNRFGDESFQEYQVQILGHEYAPHIVLLAEFFRVIQQINQQPLKYRRVVYLYVREKIVESVAEYFFIA
jgi:hypothetical protein